MFIRRVISSLSRLSIAPGQLRMLSSLRSTVSASNTPDDDKPVRAVRELKPWRKPQNVNSPFSNIIETTESKRKKRLLPKKQVMMPIVELKHWFRRQTKNLVKVSQQFIEARHTILGCDLATAHFLLYRGGKVKFWGKPNWFALQEDGTVDLPIRYDPDWQLTEVDASGVDLYYEGIENFQNLNKVHTASFAKNRYLDEWCIDKIAGNFPVLEHLDISECPMITERALEPIHKLFYLKKLTVTNWKNLPSFQLACVMLQDCNPNLTVVFKDPENDNIMKKSCIK